MDVIDTANLKKLAIINAKLAELSARSPGDKFVNAAEKKVKAAMRALAAHRALSDAHENARVAHVKNGDSNHAAYHEKQDELHQKHGNNLIKKYKLTDMRSREDVY